MNCKRYNSMEDYYGVEGAVPTMTSSFWECEPEEEDIVNYFMDYLDDNGELLYPDYPQGVFIYCDECDQEFEFDDITPGDVFSKEELYKINEEAIQKWIKDGDVDKDDAAELREENEKILKGDENDN